MLLVVGPVTSVYFIFLAHSTSDRTALYASDRGTSDRSGLYISDHRISDVSVLYISGTVD